MSPRLRQFEMGEIGPICVNWGDENNAIEETSLFMVSLLGSIVRAQRRRAEGGLTGLSTKGDCWRCSAILLMCSLHICNNPFEMGSLDV